MTIDELLRGRNLTPKQTMTMRTAHGEDPDGFARIIAKTSTANSPTAALVSAIQRGEHRSTRAKSTVRKRDKITTLIGAVDYALAAYRARMTAYPPTDTNEWHEGHHLIYAADLAAEAARGRWDAGLIEFNLRLRLEQTQLRIVGGEE